MPEDFSTDELLFQLTYFPQPPYMLAGIGLAVGVLCGLTFGKLVQKSGRLEGTAPFPSAMPKS